LLNDASYWRRLKAAAHPDRNGGDGDLFLFLSALEEHVAQCPRMSCVGVGEGGYAGPGYGGGQGQSQEEKDRIPYESGLGWADTFVDLTLRALSIAEGEVEPYRSVLLLLRDCPAHEHGREAMRQCRGASYPQLAKIGHMVGMSRAGRAGFYEVARSIPLSEAHAKHILGRLHEREAGAA